MNIASVGETNVFEPPDQTGMISTGDVTAVSVDSAEAVEEVRCARDATMDRIAVSARHDHAFPSSGVLVDGLASVTAEVAHYETDAYPLAGTIAVSGVENGVGMAFANQGCQDWRAVPWQQPLPYNDVPPAMSHPQSSMSGYPQHGFYFPVGGGGFISTPTEGSAGGAIQHSTGRPMAPFGPCPPIQWAVNMHLGNHGTQQVFDPQEYHQPAQMGMYVAQPSMGQYDTRFDTQVGGGQLNFNTFVQHRQFQQVLIGSPATSLLPQHHHPQQVLYQQHQQQYQQYLYQQHQPGYLHLHLHQLQQQQQYQQQQPQQQQQQQPRKHQQR